MLFFVDSKSDKKTFFLSLFLTSFVTVVAKFGNAQFEEIRIEQVGTKSFELFSYLYLMLTGFVLASSFKEKSGLRKFFLNMKKYVKSLYFSAGGALVGWGLGLIIYVIFIGEYKQLPLGFFVTFLLTALIIIPAYYYELSLLEKHKVTGLIFTVPKNILLIRVLGLCLITLGGYSLYFLTFI